jgi:uncharacterized phage-associated protein
MPHRPLTIANEFIRLHGGNTGIDHLKLQKLTYLANGWWLARKGMPLTAERPQVWRYGPVFRSLYNSLAGFGKRPIIWPVGPFEGRAPEFPTSAAEERKLIDWVWRQYGALKGTELSNLTHARGTPWRRIAERYDFVVPQFLEIPESEDRDFFSELEIQLGAGGESEPLLTAPRVNT